MSTGVSIVINQAPAGGSSNIQRVTIVGAPDVTAEDIGKYLRVASSEPLTLEWATAGSGGTPTVTRVADGTVNAGSFGRASTNADNKVAQLRITDDPLLRTCIILDDGTNGQSVRVVEARGYQVEMLVDSAGALTAGSYAYFSQIINGILSSDDSGAFAGIVRVAGSANGTAEIMS